MKINEEMNRLARESANKAVGEREAAQKKADADRSDFEASRDKITAEREAQVAQAAKAEASQKEKEQAQREGEAAQKEKAAKQREQEHAAAVKAAATVDADGAADGPGSKAGEGVSGFRIGGNEGNGASVEPWQREKRNPGEKRNGKKRTGARGEGWTKPTPAEIAETAAENAAAAKNMGDFNRQAARRSNTQPMAAPSNTRGCTLDRPWLQPHTRGCSPDRLWLQGGR